MNNYSTIIEDIYSPELEQKDNIYSEFTNYFSNLPFTKIENKGNYSVYMCKITCQLCIVKKYLIAFVSRDENPVNFVKNLSELKWICFQAQTSTMVHKLENYSYSKKNLPFFNSKITVINRSPEKVTYKMTDIPLKVELIPKNTKQKEYNKYEYADEGTLRHAIETFKTIITFV